MDLELRQHFGVRWRFRLFLRNLYLLFSDFLARFIMSPDDSTLLSHRVSLTFLTFRMFFRAVVFFVAGPFLPP